MNVILTVVSLSVSASILFLLYLAARRLLRRLLPASALYALLLVILLRLLIPYSPAFALMNRLTDLLPTRTAAGEGDGTADLPKPSAPTLVLTDEGNDTVGGYVGNDTAMQTPSAEGGEMRGDTASYADGEPSGEFPWAAAVPAAWLVVALGIGGFHITAYAVFRRRILWDADYSEIHTQMLHDIAGRRRYPGVFLSPCADTPMVLGLLNPVIVLPCEDYTLNEVEHILRHELCHYRRFDVGFKWLGILAGALHWFNPLMILFRREWEEICECSCDEAVTRGMDAAGRKAYIRTLLKTAAWQVNANTAPFTAMSGGAKRLDERFAAIAGQKRLTPARAALSFTAIACTAAIGLGLGACPFPTAQKEENESPSAAPYESAETDYLAYQYGFEGMSFEVTDPDAFYDAQQQVWRVPMQNDTYVSKPTLAGGTQRRIMIHAVYQLLDFEQYERIGEVQSMSFFAGDALQVSFWTDELHYDTLCFYLEKDGNLFVWLNKGDEADLYHPDTYRDYPNYLKSSNMISVFEVPDDLYGKAASLLYPLAEISAQEGLESVKTYYPADEIGNDFVYAVISDKIRILSDDFGCNFYADVGDQTYERVWHLFKNIGQCDEIQPRPELAQTDGHIMIIGPEDYGAEYVGEYITVYADSGVICARFKGDEMWYSVPKDLVKQCGEIAALQL